MYPSFLRETSHVETTSSKVLTAFGLSALLILVLSSLPILACAAETRPTQDRNPSHTCHEEPLRQGHEGCSRGVAMKDAAEVWGGSWRERERTAVER